MKTNKLVALVSAVAIFVTNLTVIAVPSVFADDSAAENTGFSEDFEDYTADADISTTLSDLMDDGWYMVGENTMYTDTSATQYQNLQSFVQVVNYAGRKCLMIGTPNQNKANSAIGIGRKFPKQGNSKRATGTWEINFKFRPYATSTAPVQFLFSMNTMDGSASTARIAQHNVVAAYNNKMYMGYRDYMTSYNGNNPIPQNTLSGSGITLDWYDVKVIVNCDERYYSVDLYKGNTLVARRSPISFAASETIGYLKWSALGLTAGHRVYIDDVKIQQVSKDNFIYNESFDAFSSVALAASSMSLGGESEDIAGTSYFGGFTPWRALASAGRDYGLGTDTDLGSKVVRLGDDPNTDGTTEKSGLVYMPVYDKLVDAITQQVRGKVKLSFKIKPAIIGNSAFSVDVAPEYSGDISKIFEIADNEGIPAIVTDNGKTDLNASKWYDAELIFDVINKMTTTTLQDHNSSEEVAKFSREFPSLVAVKGIIFNALGGTSVYMDDIKIEYYEDVLVDFDEMTELMEIGMVKSGNTPVESLSDITNDADITVRVAYANKSDAPLRSLLFVAYYGDDMLLATSSVKPATVDVGEKGIKSFSFVVPSAAELDMNKVDKISVCLWNGFKKSVPYCDVLDITGTQAAEPAATETPVTGGSGNGIKYSYNNSVLNISGTADSDSKNLTVQILKPGNTFDAADASDCDVADGLVLYRAQIPVTDGKYSLDVRFDSKMNTESTLVSGDYPAAIYIDDTKLDTDSVYICSYPDFKDACTKLNDAAASDNFTEFKNILNSKRQALNFNSKLLGNAVLGDEIEPYFTYIKENPLNSDNEIKNSETFNTFIAIEYINSEKTDNISDDIDGLLIDDSVKDFCRERLVSDEKSKYFTSLIGKNISSPDQLAKSINKALILTAAKYGNGYGELKSALELCGSDIGIDPPISDTACRELMGMTFGDTDSFKTAYNEKLSTPVVPPGGGGGGGGGAGGDGGSAAPASTKPPIVTVKVSATEAGFGTPEVEPVTKTFNDIDNYEWAMTAILALADRNIINGVDEDRFDPARNITREEFVKILVGALGVTDYSYKENVFNDVSVSDWFVDYINIAAELGIVNGIGDGRFGTGSNITRQDMAVMIYKALQYRNVNMTLDGFRFDDNGMISDYARDAVNALHGMGAINGVTDTTFEPIGLATRAQAAKIIYYVLSELQG